MNPHPATVTSTAPLTVRLDTSTSAAPAVQGVYGYTPAAGDRVAVMQMGRQLLVMAVLPS